MQLYITISDPIGGIYMGDNSPVVVNHRVLLEDEVFYGYENLAVLFSKEGRLHELQHMLMLAVQQPSGSYDRFTWEHK